MDVNHLVISITSGLVGFLLGWLVRGIADRSGKEKDMKTLVLLIVSCAWFISVIVEIINPAYHTNPMIHGLMGSIVGFFYKFEPKKMTRAVQHAKNNVLFILGCALVFAFLGQAIPNIYFRYIDKTVYYEIKSPVEVEKSEYKPGETVVVEFNRNSLICTEATSVVDLVLYENNREVTHYKRDIALDIGKQKVQAIFDLPQNLTPGNYFFRGVVSFRVRDVPKTASFYTDTFDVKN